MIIYDVLQHYYDNQVQSWELELVADVTTSWKQQRSVCTQSVKKHNERLFEKM